MLRGSTPEVCVYTSVAAHLIVDEVAVLPADGVPLAMLLNEGDCGLTFAGLSPATIPSSALLSVMPTGGTGPYAIDVNAPPGWTFTMAGNRLNLTDGSSVPYSWDDPVPITVTITDVAGAARVQALELLGLVLC